MKEELPNLTKSDLKVMGLSDYLVREICNELSFTRMKTGAREYSRSDLRESIIRKLFQPKIKSETRERLQLVLKLLEEKSNVIEVDFLKKLPLEERIDFLKNYREELRTKGEVILKDVDELLKQSRNPV